MSGIAGTGAVVAAGLLLVAALVAVDAVAWRVVGWQRRRQIPGGKSKRMGQGGPCV